jgi:hypothetical protein
VMLQTRSEDISNYTEGLIPSLLFQAYTHS